MCKLIISKARIGALLVALLYVPIASGTESELVTCLKQLVKEDTIGKDTLQNLKKIYNSEDRSCWHTFAGYNELEEIVGNLQLVVFGIQSPFATIGDKPFFWKMPSYLRSMSGEALKKEGECLSAYVAKLTKPWGKERTEKILADAEKKYDLRAETMGFFLGHPIFQETN